MVNNTVSPTCSITSPTSGQVVSGVVAVGVSVSGMTASSVEVSWDTGGLTVGSHPLVARATGTITTESTAVQVTVGTASTESLTIAVSEAAADGTVLITAVVTGGTAGAVEFLVDGTPVGTDSTVPFQVSVNQNDYSDEVHVITARVVGPASQPFSWEPGTRTSSSRLGLESFWHYIPVVAGNGNGYLNVSNGNFVYQSMRMSVPGRMS